MSGQLGRRVSFSQAAALVKAQLDILDAVSRHVTLKRQGRNHWGVCPFHKEKTPSFSVAADKGLFKCFGCGEAGDAIGFLMKIERKSYPELIREAADALGLEVEEREPPNDQDGINRSLLLALNAAALDYFQQSLESPLGEDAKVLLQNRQFSEVVWQDAQLGYAPNAWQGLMQFIQRSGEFSHVQNVPKALVEAGLVIEKTDEATGNTRYFDRFRHRIMIPITDAQNRVVAFGARAIAAAEDPNGMPKYINSPETRLYQKSNVLFGFSRARAAIADQKSAVVMEGYFDVLTAHRQGVTACVASCGTALTEQQAKLLQRAGAETIYLAFDSDQAGHQAALNAIQRLDALLGQYPSSGGATSGARLALKILRMPPEAGAKDPDDLLRHASSREDAQGLWQSVLQSAQDAVRFKCDHALQGLSFGEAGVSPADAMQIRLEAAHRLVPILANLPNRIMQAEYIGFYANYCGLDEASLMSDVADHAKASPRKPLEKFSGKLSEHPDAQMFVSPQSQTSKKYPATFATNPPLLATFDLEDSLNQHRVSNHGPTKNGSSLPGSVPQRSHHTSSRYPVSRIRAAETLLLKLLLMNTASLQAFYPRLSSVAFTEKDLAAIWAAISFEVTAFGTALLEDFVRLTQLVQDHLRTHNLDQPDVTRSFADLLFHAGDLADSLTHVRRATLPASKDVSSLVSLPAAAEKAFQDALKSHAHAQRLKAVIPLSSSGSASLAPTAAADPHPQLLQEQLENQYALREQLPVVQDKPHQISLRSVLGWPSR